MEDSVEDGRGAAAGRQRIVPYLNGLYGYAIHLSGDAERARDLVQTCAMKALGTGAAPADEAAYRIWLFRILRNAYFDEWRKQRQELGYRAELGRDADCAGARNSVPLPDVFSVEKHMITLFAVREGLDKLGLIHREILILVDAAGFTYHEAAALLQIPVGTVMSRVSRARRMLLLALGERAARTPRLALVRRRK